MIMTVKQTKSIPRCERCAFRAVYDANPKSFLGRLWRLHISWCPGWRRYMQALGKKQRVELATRYHLQRYLKQ